MMKETSSVVLSLSVLPVAWWFVHLRNRNACPARPKQRIHAARLPEQKDLAMKQNIAAWPNGPLITSTLVQWLESPLGVLHQFKLDLVAY
jgi:hypothetical protein